MSRVAAARTWRAICSSSEAGSYLRLIDFVYGSDEVASMSGGRQIVSEAFHLAVRVPDQKCQAKRGKQVPRPLSLIDPGLVDSTDFSFITSPGACARAPREHDRLSAGLWEGCRESRRCSRDTYPESYITEFTCIRRKISFLLACLGSPGQFSRPN